MEMEIKRGDIFLCCLEKQKDSSVMYGERPVIVVSNDMANQFSKVISIVPLTTKKKRKLPTHVEIKKYGLKQSSIALVEQVMSVDVKNISKKIGSIRDTKELTKIEKCLSIQFGGNEVA